VILFPLVQVKKQRHDQLPLHGAGKKFSKGEVERILHRMVNEKILMEDLSKSENWGSILSYLKVRDGRVHLVYTRQSVESEKTRMNSSLDASIRYGSLSYLKVRGERVHLVCNRQSVEAERALADRARIKYMK
jgi:superfamily II DNA helicase RecQ